VLRVSTAPALDRRLRPIDYEQAAAVKTRSDERGGDSGAAADLEQAFARLDAKHLDRPTNPLRVTPATVAEPG
jgi:hypothetical protein